MLLSKIDLPPGHYRNSCQWVCDCPFCGREEHFEWHVSDIPEENKGFCFVCNSSCKNLYELRMAFSGKLDQLPVIVKNKIIKNWNIHDRVCAWDHPISRAWCLKKNYYEGAIRTIGIEYSVSENQLWMLAACQNPSFAPTRLRRPLSGLTQKWIGPEGKGTYYAWNADVFHGSGRNCLWTEGLGDLICTGLWPYGMAMLGSNIDDSWWFWASQNLNKVFLWFDADEAGEKAYAKCIEQAKYYGMKKRTFIIRTELDPKFHLRNVESYKPFLETLRSRLCES